MIILAGASASGKTEAAKLLYKKYGVIKAITTTTRDKRVGEVDGKDYFFVDKDVFFDMITEDRFVEYTEYNGNFYGSTKDQVAPSKCVVIDLAGLKSYIELDRKEIVTFFLDSSEKIRCQRMKERGDDLKKIKSRLAHDRIIFKKEKIPNVDVHIDSENLTIEEMTDQIYHLYKEELKKRNINL